MKPNPRLPKNPSRAGSSEPGCTAKGSVLADLFNTVIADALSSSTMYLIGNDRHCAACDQINCPFGLSHRMHHN
jgi:hypothetical protein